MVRTQIVEVNENNLPATNYKLEQLMKQNSGAVQMKGNNNNNNYINEAY